MAAGETYSPNTVDSRKSTEVPAPNTPTNWYMSQSTTSSTGIPHRGWVDRSPSLAMGPEARRAGRYSAVSASRSAAFCRAWAMVISGGVSNPARSSVTRVRIRVAPSGPRVSVSQGSRVSSPARSMRARPRRATWESGRSSPISRAAA